MKKKRFPFASKKTTTSVFTLFFFLVLPKQQQQLCLLVLFWYRPKWKKKFSLLLRFIKRHKKSNSNFLHLFVLFFASLNDDNWWQVGGWYGIPNLVMTWWLWWVEVTKLSKCWWRHIEMVPTGIEKKSLLWKKNYNNFSKIRVNWWTKYYISPQI